MQDQSEKLLPAEIWALVITHLNYVDILNLRLVTKYLRVLARDPLILQHKIISAEDVLWALNAKTPKQFVSRVIKQYIDENLELTYNTKLRELKSDSELSTKMAFEILCHQLLNIDSSKAISKELVVKTHEILQDYLLAGTIKIQPTFFYISLLKAKNTDSIFRDYLDPLLKRDKPFLLASGGLFALFLYYSYPNADLSCAIFRNITFSEANFDNSNFSEADFAGITILGSCCRSANFTNADLHDAKIRNTNFKNAIFIGANLSGAEINYCDLSFADLTHANLIGIKFIPSVDYTPTFSGATFTNAKFFNSDTIINKLQQTLDNLSLIDRKLPEWKRQHFRKNVAKDMKRVLSEMEEKTHHDQYLETAINHPIFAHRNVRWNKFTDSIFGSNHPTHSQEILLAYKKTLSTNHCIRSESK